MADKTFSINVTTSTPKRVSVSSRQVANEITAGKDLTKYYSELAKSWAISSAIVENTDHSAKYYAERAKNSETGSKAYYNATQTAYADFTELASSSIEELRTEKNNALNSINELSENSIKEIEVVSNNNISSIEYTTGKNLVRIEEVKSSAITQILQEGYSQVANVKSTGFYMRNDKLYFINSKGEEEEFKSGGGLEIGDIGIAPLGIDETQGKRRYLNGQVIIQEQYVSFTEKLKKAVELYPSLACTESEWQTTSTMTVGGQVGKFVIDDEAGTIRLPKIIMPIQGLTDLSKLAEIVKAGLPNITGSVDVYYAAGVSGAFQAGATSNINKYPSGTGGGNVTTKTFDASRSSSIYSNSDTVQQEQIQYPYFIQVATGAEESIDITREIELNNPFSLLDYKFSEYELNNLSWLRSNSQWNSKAIYPAVYELLLKIYNGTETKAGVSVKLTTEDYSDVDFVLNTAVETFRLPLSVNNSTQGYLYFYVGETIQNANLVNAGRIQEKLSDCITRLDCSAYIVETYANGASGYNIWSNGYCEQWGSFSSNDSVSTTVTFLKVFSNTNYNCQVSMFGTAGLDQYKVFVVTSKANSSVVIKNITNGTNTCMWRACGYIA